MSPRVERADVSSEYKARATMLVVSDEDEGVGAQNDIWIEIKEIMLKHFLPEDGKRLREVRDKVAQLNQRKTEINKRFESAFLIANSETLKNIGEYSVLKQSVEDIKLFNLERKSLLDSY